MAKHWRGSLIHTGEGKGRGREGREGGVGEGRLFTVVDVVFVESAPSPLLLAQILPPAATVSSM